MGERHLLMLCGACGVLWVAVGACMWMTFTPGLSNVLTAHAALFGYMGTYLATAALCVVAVLHVANPRREPPRRLRAAGGVAIVIAVAVGGSWTEERLRLMALRRCTARLEPLVNAIEAYERERGHPPASLAWISTDRSWPNNAGPAGRV